jgi:tRNA(Arg) A34 adenosine deaminase TadA
MISPSEWMRHAIDLAVENVRQRLGGPFGAVVVLDGAVIGSGANAVTATNDPTAHAEVMAIRAACRALGSFRLTGAEIYTSCEPCPMCLGAIYWARLARIYYAATRADAAAAGFDDAHIYDELNLDLAKRAIPCSQLLRDHAAEPFHAWRETIQRVPY